MYILFRKHINESNASADLADFTQTVAEFFLRISALSQRILRNNAMHYSFNHTPHRKSLQHTCGSIFMTSLKLILSEIRDKNQCPPRKAGRAGKSVGSRAKNFLPPSSSIFAHSPAIYAANYKLSISSLIIFDSELIFSSSFLINSFRFCILFAI